MQRYKKRMKLQNKKSRIKLDKVYFFYAVEHHNRLGVGQQATVFASVVLFFSRSKECSFASQLPHLIAIPAQSQG
jgi:hypothetical protein